MKAFFTNSGIARALGRTGAPSLMVAKHQGIRSLGEAMGAGIATCLLVSLTLLPCVMILLARGGWTIKPIKCADEGWTVPTSASGVTEI